MYFVRNAGIAMREMDDKDGNIKLDRGFNWRFLFPM